MEWRNPANDKPPAYEDVILFYQYEDESPCIGLGWYSYFDKSWRIEVIGDVKCLAWMPLPEPPKGDI